MMKRYNIIVHMGMILTQDSGIRQTRFDDVRATETCQYKYSGNFLFKGEKEKTLNIVDLTVTDSAHVPAILKVELEDEIFDNYFRWGCIEQGFIYDYGDYLLLSLSVQEKAFYLNLLGK